MKALCAWRTLLWGLFGGLAAVVAVPVAEGTLALASVLTPTDAVTPPMRVSNESAEELLGESFISSISPPPDFRERLAPRRGRGGDVQISLIWDDTNDLDLHCVGPDGYELYPGTKDTQSPTGGAMDLDANASCYARELTRTPVENIYWAVGRAPAGAYRVYVSVYERCEPAAPLTKYRMSIFANGRRWEQEGSITHAERKGKQLVTEFTLEQQTQKTIPESAPPASATADNTAAATKHAMRPSPVGYGLWVVPLVAGIALGLLAARNYLARRRPRLTPTHVAVAGSAAVTGFISVWLGQRLDQQLHSDGVAGVGSAIGWLLLAVFTVLFVSSSPPKVEVKKRAYIGLVGGLLAVGLFFIGASREEWVGRALSGIAVGLSCGVAVGAAMERRTEPVAPEATNPLPLHPPRVSPPAAPKPPPPPVSRPSPPVPVNPRPTVTTPVAPPRPTVTTPVAPPRPKPTPPTAPTTSKPPLNPDACPTCGRKNPGRPGARQCIVCDITY